MSCRWCGLGKSHEKNCPNNKESMKHLKSNARERNKQWELVEYKEK